MAAHSDTTLIAIDTLQRIRETGNDKNSYASDYEHMTVLKKIADRFNIAILVVHHMRKMPDDDPINMVSGSTGIIGAVDSVFVLNKDKRSSNKAKMVITGRDVSDQILLLEFDRDFCIWRLVGKGEEEIAAHDCPALPVIASFMESRDEWEGNATELLEHLQKIAPVRGTSATLSKNLRKHISSLLNTYHIHFSGDDRSGKKRRIHLKKAPE